MLLSNFLHDGDSQYWYEVTKHQDLQDQKKNHVEDLYYNEQEMHGIGVLFLSINKINK
jgi:hypothetical protein